MIENLFREQLVKNNITPNILNNTDCVNIHKVESLYKLKCRSIFNSVGLICINIENVDGVCEIYLDVEQIIYLNKSGTRIIPIELKKEFCLKLVGCMTGINIVLIGGCFDNKPLTRSLPMNNIYLSGSEKSAYTYSLTSDIIDGNESFSEQESDSVFIQTLLSSSSDDIGKIFKNDNVYFCTKLNNYTDKILVAEQVDDAIFLQNSDDNIIKFLILNNQVINFKALINSVISDIELELQLPKNLLPVNFVPCISLWGYSRIFGLKMSNGKYFIYALKSVSVIEKLFEIKAENIKIIEKQDVVYVVVFNQLKMTVYIFDIDMEKDYSNILHLVETKTYSNIIDLIVTIDSYIGIHSSGHKTYIEI